MSTLEENNVSDTAAGAYFWPNFFAKTISIAYAVLFLVSAVQLALALVGRNKALLSFRTAFLATVFVWSLLRVVFWFFVELHSSSVLLSTSVFFLPGSLQLAAFSLLLLFFVKLVHRHHWRALKRFFITACVVFNSALLTLTFLFAVLLDRLSALTEPETEDAAHTSAILTRFFYILSGSFFGLLACVALYYVRRLAKMRALQQGTSHQELLVAAAIFALFLTRCTSFMCGLSVNIGY